MKLEELQQDKKHHKHNIDDDTKMKILSVISSNEHKPPKEILKIIKKGFGDEAIPFAKDNIKNKIFEATEKVPILDEDFEKIKIIMNKPLLAKEAIEILTPILKDDGLYDNIDFVKRVHPNKDVRPIVSDWLKLFMPSSMKHFRKDNFDNHFGFNSVIPGEDPHEGRPVNLTTPHNAVGRFY